MTSAPKHPRWPRLARWLARLSLICVSLAIALAVVDWAIYRWDLFGVRHGEQVQLYRTQALLPTWTDPQGEHDLDGTLFEHRNDFELDLGRYRLITNSHGFRGPNIKVPKPEGVHRTVVLGDSVAFGLGVDDEVTFLRRFENALNSRATAAQRFEIVNTGIPMYDSMQQLAMLERHGLEVQPDAVALVFVVNDIEPSRTLVEALLGVRDLPAPPPTPPPTLVDRVATLAHACWLPNIAQVLRIWAPANQDWDAILAEHGGEYIPEQFDETRVRGWQRSQAALRKMRDVCTARGIPFVVLDHSYPPVRALPGFCSAEGIPYQELRFTDVELGQPIYNSAMDPHSNELGHTILLEKLEQAWSALGLPGAR